MTLVIRPRYRSFPTRLVLVASTLAVLAATGSAVAVERGPYGIEILVDGRPLEEHHARGATYVEALCEREYSVRLYNRTPVRVAVALAVDGLNSIDARTTTSRDAAKWILGPYETITLDGWQTSAGTARHFFFTTEERSYGEWLGRSENLGVVAAAFFREKRPYPLRDEAEVDARRAPAAAPPEQEKAAAQEPTSGSRADTDDLAATGIGREVDHRVQRVVFEEQERPAATIEIRYEYRDALVRLGVLPAIDEPLARRERARGFEDFRFAPDPFRH